MVDGTLDLSFKSLNASNIEVSGSSRTTIIPTLITKGLVPK
jgi:hypothetical protein